MSSSLTRVTNRFFPSDLVDKGHATKDDINSYPWHISGKVGWELLSVFDVKMRHSGSVGDEAQWVCGGGQRKVRGAQCSHGCFSWVQVVLYCVV